ncbi:DNA-binding response regulator [Ammoniphilus resinae]|uniref:DNA-binding response regulator n=1 Tax=Ammoniphilus resinae TaxID=861532 RepID=A0ABS4GIK9_9BACL|nr:DNA-binding response regulator [Ammoniphilus resinae]MBP1930098.1 hypothetical protein [Ammoniphilus resinae]
MGFEEEYQAFLLRHSRSRKGERLRRLMEGHGPTEKMFLENVWWPLFSNFHYLHPEYEVADFKDGRRYLDFAYIRTGARICFEIDGYGPHLRNVSRWQFSDNLERQNQLVIDGWVVIRFSYDQIAESPRRCQQTTQQIIGKILGQELDPLALSPMEKEVVRLALRKESSFTPREICEWLHISDRSARKILAGMAKKGAVIPFGGKQRIRSYQIGEAIRNNGKVFR